MTPENITNLLGHSVHHPEFQSMLQELKFDKQPYAEADRHGVSVYGVYNKEIGLALDFSTTVGFTNQFGTPDSTYTGDKYELILKEIGFSKGAVRSLPLPYGLSFGDPEKEILEKMGAKPYEKSKGFENNFIYYFIADDRRVQVMLDKDKKLVSLRCYVLELSQRKNIALKNALKDQKRKLHGLGAEIREKLRLDMPTHQWRKRMKDGDVLFTTDNIAATEEKLVQFIDQADKAGAEKKSGVLYNTLKRTVVALNKINEQQGSFIDTREREEIVTFLQDVVSKTGFHIPEGHDLTGEWREW